jgi:hypothetical protein
MRGEFAGFTEVDATDASVRGRDVLDHFDVRLSRRRNEGISSAQRYHYRVEQGWRCLRELARPQATTIRHPDSHTLRQLFDTGPLIVADRIC